MKVAGHIFGTKENKKVETEEKDCPYQSFEEAELALMGVLGGK